jgi:2-methylisocitrate lyase-like PEP mutase family enzyme
MTTQHAGPHERAGRLLELHEAHEVLALVNVWDVASATALAALPETRAIATASHAIAAAFGYEDGERIPVDLMLDMVGRIALCTDLPVTADLEAGYGSPGETVRRAIGMGVVGANLEDGMRPHIESVENVASAVNAAHAEGVASFVLNARTDALLLRGDRPLDDAIEDAVERGRAYLDAGAACVFVPGTAEESVIERLVAGIGDRRVSVLGHVHSPLSPQRLAALGVARVSYGPYPQAAALAALQHVARDAHAGRPHEQPGIA